MAHTFESLSKLGHGELEAVLTAGEEPALDGDVVGWEFQGWNVNPLAAVLASRKFKKGVYAGTEGGDPPPIWGYNMTVRQNAFDGPWIPTPTPEDPNRRFFFGVVPGARAHRPKYPRTLVIDYRLWKGYLPINPIGYTVDYLVHPNPGDKTLLLGKSYAEPGLRIFQGFFLLRRDERRSGYRPR